MNKSIVSDAVKRKTRKLYRDPKLFFIDFLKNRRENFRLHTGIPLPIKKRGGKKYSVVSAVYGVEKYLDDFFKSLVRQTLDFEEHIELIMVDDGSPDRSATIIKRWMSKYPNNIKYIRKENGGQASARNLGLQMASHAWITFIDPDDVLNKTYFEEVDRCLREYPEVAIVSCNFIFYFEQGNRLSDTHPLKYRFEKDLTIKDISSLYPEIQLSVNSVFVRTDDLVASGIEMDPKVVPNFEDAHFINRYMMRNLSRQIAFVKGARYLYRKRSDGTSTLDRSWEGLGQFSDKIKYGNLDLLEKASRASGGRAPAFVQRAVLYDFMWTLRGLLDGKVSVSHWGEEFNREFHWMLEKVFSYIDQSEIERFNLAGCWFLHKVGMLGALKSLDPTFQIAYIKGYDIQSGLVELSYFSHEQDVLVRLLVDGVEVYPRYRKVRSYSMAGRHFVNEFRLWVPVPINAQYFDIEIDRKATYITLDAKQRQGGVPVREIARTFSVTTAPSIEILSIGDRVLRQLALSQWVVKKYSRCWLLMDRDVQADDNAEHLYRYIMENHPEINAYFILRKSSHDWNRLRHEGFRLLAFGSVSHKLALLHADHLISSHADQYITSVLQKNRFSDLQSWKYTFLQHGVTQNDLSQWLNTKDFSCVVTSTRSEYESIAADGTPYKFARHQVVLTGFPRHDALIKRRRSCSGGRKVLLIMPTWRQNVVGATKGKGHNRQLSTDFFETRYAKSWKSLLHSEALARFSKAEGCKVVFFPHANIQPYLKGFDCPAYIEVRSHVAGESIQDLFCEADMMLTDYSSVAFEMALLDKPVVYYQFDRDEVFGGGHTTRPGYFQYQRDGFGPVCDTREEAIQAIETIAANGWQLLEPYRSRVARTFKFRDGRCCERVFEAISALGQPKKDLVNPEIMSAFATSALRHQRWTLAEARYRDLLKAGEVGDADWQGFAKALLRQGKFREAVDALKQIPIDSRGARWHSEMALVKRFLRFQLMAEEGKSLITSLRDNGFVFKGFDISFIRALADLSAWEAVCRACAIVSKEEGGESTELMRLWSAASDRVGANTLLYYDAMEKNRNQKKGSFVDRRSATRPWANRGKMASTFAGDRSLVCKENPGRYRA